MDIYCFDFLDLFYLVLTIFRYIILLFDLYNKKLKENENPLLGAVLLLSNLYSFILVFFILICVCICNKCAPPQNRLQFNNLIWLVSIMYIFDAINFVYIKNIIGIGNFFSIMIFSDIILFLITICFAIEEKK